uniref:TSA: Wollemia nobilis Ref_Wollemi_Transcript_6869_1098 transcribed RNA sequence n=1 Tax=Wollemia nobilis TaxID=56998 RepID=A0A0C9RX91_9CONI
MAVNNGLFLRKFSLPKDIASLCFLPNNLSFPNTLTAHRHCFADKTCRIFLKKKIVRETKAKDEKWGDKMPPFANGNPGIDCPVPFDQQPVNEYQSLANSDLFSWANEDIWKYGLRLLGIGTAFTVFIGWPVASLSVNPEQELLKCGVGALSGGLLVVIMAALRMYLGWAYVGNRLFSATVEYEETGWYDGEHFPLAVMCDSSFHTLILAPSPR